jgi:hypothetical protein
MKSRRFDTSGFRSKSWDEFAVPNAPLMDFVFTVCDEAAAEECPIWPGHPLTAHWGIPDPAKAEGSDLQIAHAYAEAFRMLDNRISIFLSLPLAKLDRLSLQTHLHNIGAMEDLDAGLAPLHEDIRGGRR